MTRASAARRTRRSAPANKTRGEHELELGGVTYLLRPSHEALDAMEQETDRSVLELMRLANSGALKLRDAGVVAAELIRAGADERDTVTRHVDAERIAELIQEEGVAKVFARLTLCLLDAAQGGRTASGEAKAATAATIEAAGAA